VVELYPDVQPPTIVQPPTSLRAHAPSIIIMGSIVLPHLRSGWHVDQAILSEEDRLVVIRFGKDGNPDCLRQDDVLSRIANAVQNFAVM
jgi:hypothetical protein